MSGWSTMTVALLAAMSSVLVVRVSPGEEMVFPVKDGTIVDGGVFGEFDGIPDAWDWTFNQTSYEGAITLATDPVESAIEHRVVWEYDLSGLGVEPPVSAILSFVLRGPPIVPFPDVEVFVYSYPADLVESPDDFSIGPTEFQGSVVVGAFQPPTAFAIDVTDVVSESFASGADRVGFRFQINPGTSNTANQAFIDATDTDPPSKPFLIITAASGTVPGDSDGDGDVDLEDYSRFLECVGSAGGMACEAFDFDSDGDVDLVDFGRFQVSFSGSGD